MKKNVLIVILFSFLFIISCGKISIENEELASDNCVEGNFKCEDLVLKKCKNNKWETLEVCSKNERCEETIGKCVDDTINDSVCGNGKLETDEECDDGNTVSSDGCDANCKKETTINPVCGNGKIETGEECDDGNTISGDGCDANCKKETTINPVCGNGKVETGEECDDGNTVSGDGCDANCKKETTTGSGVYGTLSGAGTFSGTLDGAKLSDEDYKKAHSSNIVMSSVFNGIYGSSKTIPAQVAGSQTFALAIHQAAKGSNPPALIVLQQTQANDGVVNPIVQMSFPSDNLKAGETFSLNPTKQGSVSLTILNSTDSQSSCLLAIAWSGTVTVIKANNTTATDGGSLQFTAKDIKFYYPKETPLGDVSSQLGSTQVCPKE